MRAFYTDPIGFTADVCLMTNGRSARVTVRSPEGSVIHTGYYPTWGIAVATIRYMLPDSTNDLTHQPI